MTLDLDIARHDDGHVVLLDEDEVEAHRRRFRAFRNAGEVARLIAWPSACKAVEAALTTSLGQLADWGTEPPLLLHREPVGPSVSGIADPWPHIAA